MRTVPFECTADTPTNAFKASRRVGAPLCLAILAGCASLMPLNANLEVARREFRLAQASEDVFLLAGSELDDASEAMDDAQSAWLRHANKERVDGLALVVTQRVATARQASAQRLVELRRLGRALEGSK